MKENQILHITPHLGGGVGRVLLSYFLGAVKNTSFRHIVACFDYANEQALDVVKNIGIKLCDKMFGKKQELLKMITEADIVLIHWWNHPLLYDFLVREQLPASRVIIWSHNSGLYPPGVFTEKVLKYPDLFVFTTPLSHNAKEVQNLSAHHKKSLRVIWSTGGVDHVKLIKSKKHFGFNVGYIGTVDYAKIHPDFLDICNRVDIPDVKFIVCGGPSEKEIKKEAEKLGIADKFYFTGPVLNIAEYLAVFDVFGYPLARYHYGTCDQALQESLAAGVVPVVLANPMESYMIRDRVTGIVAKNKKAYIKSLQDLYDDRVLRNSLSKKARKYAINTFSLEKMVSEWNIIFNEALIFAKTIKQWQVGKEKEVDDLTPKDVFLEALGEQYGKDFISYCDAKNVQEKKSATSKIKKLAESANWRAETRGTVHHYNYFFPNDHHLSTWSQLMKNSF